MIRKNKIITLLFSTLCCCNVLFAQQYRHTSKIDTVPQSGFYKITITPALSAYCKPDFSDLRIIDSAGQNIPFIIRNSFPILFNTTFDSFPIIQKALVDSERYAVIIENTTNQTMDELVLNIKNTSVKRLATLSGTNKKDWFIIADNISIADSNAATTDESFMQIVQFPATKYHYLKLTIHNGGTDPIDILEAGVFFKKSVKAETHYIENSPVTFLQKDSSNGKSYIKISNPNNEPFDKIKINISAPKYFLRNAELYLPVNDTLVNTLASESFAAFQLKSNADNTFAITRQKVKVLYLVISNGDNPPIKIDTIATFQIQNEVVAYLEKDKSYTLLFDNLTASFPDYDLEKFRDSIPTLIKEVAISSITFNNQNKIVINQNKQDNKNWIWITIAIAGLALAFLTYRLINEIKKSKI